MNKDTYIKKALERDMILFNWKSNTPDLKLPLFPEWYLTMFGSLGYNLEAKKWVVGVPELILDEYGDYKYYTCHTLNSEGVINYTQLKNHEEVVICGNTPLYRPFTEEREFFASMKEEADKSILCEIINTRFSKAVIVENDKKKNQVVKAFKDVINGYPVVLTTQLLEELNTIDLTDPRSIELMQYLSSFYQTMEKREANDAGIDLDLLDKRAQVSREEIKQYDDVTTLRYLQMYEMRRRFADEMKEHGYDIEIVRNPVFYDEPTDSDIDDGTFKSAEVDDTKETDPEVEIKDEEVVNND